MSSSPEIQYDAVSACRFTDGKITPHADAAWQINAEEGLPCVFSAEGLMVRIPPQHWSDDQFHETLRAPTSSFCCQWQAKARECVAVALSPNTASFHDSSTYVVCLGAVGNTQTTLHRGTKNRATVPSRVCQERAWTSYWICLLVSGEEDSKTVVVYVGVGEIPGQQCIAILEDTTVEQQEECRYYVGFGNRAVYDRQAPVPLHVRNIRVSSMPEDLVTTLNTLSSETLALIYVGVEDMDPETQKLVKEYQVGFVEKKSAFLLLGVIVSQNQSSFVVLHRNNAARRGLERPNLG
jgi:hypothetical protein